jgi:CHAD domain-containing protein
MRFHLDPAPALGESFRALLCAEGETARAAAETAAQERDAALRSGQVRVARKTLKRLRAAMLLLDGTEPQIGPRWRRVLRDAGRLLAGARDRHVRAAGLEGFAEALPDDARATLLRWAEEARGGAGEIAAATEAEAESREAQACAEVAERLAEWLPQWAVLPTDSMRWWQVRRALARRWNRLRRRLREDLAAGDDEHLHEGRKSCGRLETLLLLVEPASPKAVAARRRRIGRIYEDLGDDRDLLMIARWVSELGDPSAPPELAGRVLGAILDRRRRLRARLGRRIRRLERLDAAAWSRVGRRRGEAPPDGAPGGE